MSHYRTTRGFFAEQFLLELNSPVNNHTVCGILAWLEGENTLAMNNPLATTRTGFSGTNFNSAGVKNYPTFSLGMRATVATIKLAPYKKLRDAIYAGTSAHAIAREIVASPWGTKDVPLSAVLANPVKYAAISLPS